MSIRIDARVAGGGRRNALLLSRLRQRGGLACGRAMEPREILQPPQGGFEPAGIATVRGLRGVERPSAGERHRAQTKDGYDGEDQIKTGNAGHGDLSSPCEADPSPSLAKLRPSREYVFEG